MTDQHAQSHCKNISWCYHLWFRILMVLVALDIIVLGWASVFGYNFFDLLVEAQLWLRIVVAVIYSLAALFIIYHTISYGKLMKKRDHVCYRCASQE